MLAFFTAIQLFGFFLGHKKSSFVGIIIPIASLISMLLPPSPPYSEMDMFREDFHTFILGFPIFIPYIHLILERLLRKDMSM